MVHLCPSYHGATLLSLILGNHSKVEALGDTVPTTAFNHQCGCGNYVAECDFWKGLATRIPDRGREHLFLTRPQIFDRSHWVGSALYGTFLDRLVLWRSGNMS